MKPIFREILPLDMHALIHIILMIIILIIINTFINRNNQLSCNHAYHRYHHIWSSISPLSSTSYSPSRSQFSGRYYLQTCLLSWTGWCKNILGFQGHILMTHETVSAKLAIKFSALFVLELIQSCQEEGVEKCDWRHCEVGRNLHLPPCLSTSTPAWSEGLLPNTNNELWYEGGRDEYCSHIDLLLDRWFESGGSEYQPIIVWVGEMKINVLGRNRIYISPK